VRRSVLTAVKNITQQFSLPDRIVLDYLIYWLLIDEALVIRNSNSRLASDNSTTAGSAPTSSTAGMEDSSETTIHRRYLVLDITHIDYRMNLPVFTPSNPKVDLSVTCR